MQVYHNTYWHTVQNVGVVPSHLAGYAPTFENMRETWDMIVYVEHVINPHGRVYINNIMRQHLR